MNKYKRQKAMIKIAVRNTLKRVKDKKVYWDNLLSQVQKPTKFDLSWARFQLWKRQSQLL